MLRVFPANPVQHPEGAVQVLTAAVNPASPDARGPILPRSRVAVAWVGDRGAGCSRSRCWPRGAATQACLEAANSVDGADERARGLMRSKSRPNHCCLLFICRRGRLCSARRRPGGHQGVSSHPHHSISKRTQQRVVGRLAQMVERSLSMREAPGSIPGLSNFAQ